MINKTLRILIVHNEYKVPGGEDSVVSSERRLLENAGHQVWSYVKNNSEIEHYHPLQKLLLPLRSVYSRKAYWEVRALILKHRIDLVHVHNTLSVISPSVYYAALSCHVPVVQTIHNFRLLCPNAILLRDGHICQDCLTHGLGQAVKHACYRSSKLQSLVGSMILVYHRKRGIYGRLTYICLTQFNKEMLLLLSHHGKPLLTSGQIYVKPNFAADPGVPVPYAERSPYFLYAGRMDRAKGIYVLLKAWEIYEKTVCERSGRPRELILCGSGPEEASVRAWIAEHSLRHVQLAGQLPHEQLLKRIRLALALCLPTQCYEGFPIVIAEAYACGTPVIGSNIGNVGNLILHGRTGLTHAPTDSAALAGYFLDWDQLSPEALAMSAQARLTYEENYTEQKNLDMLLHIYEKALDGK